MIFYKVRLDRGPWERPADHDEAIQWWYERILLHRRRGRHLCRWSNAIDDCRRPIGRCCEGGDLVAKRGWRVTTWTS